MSKNIRNVDGNNVQDPAILHNLEYNDAAGSKKVSEVGRHLIPIPFINAGSLDYTTDASTAIVLPRAGYCLAVYNKDTVIRAVTLGEDATVTALLSGATNTAGHVGIPCAPGAWTYIATSAQNWVITENNKLLVFLIDDNTSVKQEAKF